MRLYLAFGVSVALVGCGGAETPKHTLGAIPDVTTTAEPEWLPFMIHAGVPAPLDPREKHLADVREIAVGGDVARVAWAPDGKHLVVHRAYGDTEIAVTIDLGSVGATAVPVSHPGEPKTRLVRLEHGGAETAFAPVLSPDRARIAWVREGSSQGMLIVASVASETSDARNELPVLAATSRSPAFLPDSRRIAFASDLDDADFQIYVADLDADRRDGAPPPRVRVTFAEGGADSPAFSPDGKHIAFVSRRHDHRGSAERYVYVARWLEDP